MLKIHQLIIFLIFSIPSNVFSGFAPVQITNEGSNFHAHAAINAMAGAEMIWTEGAFPRYSILSSTCTDGVWSFPSTLATGITDDAKVGMDAEGNAVAVWVEKQLEDFVIRSSCKPVGQSWSSPTTLSSSALNFSPKLAMNEEGLALAAWLDGTSNTLSVSCLISGNAWSAPTTVSSSLSDFDLSIDSSGNGYLIWTTPILTHSSSSEVYASVLKAGSSWSEETLLSSNGYYQTPKIKTGCSNQALAMWTNRSTGEVFTMQYLEEWTLAPSVVSDDFSKSATVAVSETSCFAAWQNINTGKIQGANLFGNTWAQPTDVSSGAYNGSPSISMRQDGSALVAWSKNGHVNAVLCPEDGTLGSETVISTQGRHVNIEAITSGMASMITWQTGGHIFANIN